MKPGTGRRERGRPGGRPPARPRRASAGEVPGAVGVDTGGTFTDFVALVGRRVLAFKLPSTPRHPHRATIGNSWKFAGRRRTHL